jgi:hypothetical protein
MALLIKPEFPPLLALGFWPHSCASLHTLCVANFPSSITRSGIMTGLKDVLDSLNGFGFKLEAWVDGSFMTQKLNPEDSDVAVRFRGEDFDAAPPAQKQAFHNFIKFDHKPKSKCDLYAFPEYASGHPLYDHGQWRRAYWLNKFGYSRAEDPKGLAVISIPYVITP